jgi:hypothetical protein
MGKLLIVDAKPDHCPDDPQGRHCGHWLMGTACCDCGAINEKEELNEKPERDVRR